MAAICPEVSVVAWFVDALTLSIEKKPSGTKMAREANNKIINPKSPNTCHLRL